MGKTFSTGLLTNGIWQDASNNIGIGAAPSGSYKLEVTGTAKVSSTLLVSGSVTSDDLILTAGTLFGAGNTGFSNRSSDTTLYLQMPATGFNITDNALNTKVIISSAGLTTFQGFGSHSFSSGGTGYNKLTIRNTTAGTGNGAQLSIGTNADPDQFYVQSFATTFTTSGMNIAGGAVVNGEGPGGLSLAATQSNIGFYTNGAGSANERMRITSGGNVLIGTSSDNGNKFQIYNGSIQLRDATSDTVYLSTNTIHINSANSSDTAASSANLRIGNNSSDRYWNISQGTAADLRIYNFNAGWAIRGSFAAASGVYTALSDINQKKDFEPSILGLDAILGLKPTLYRMKSEDESTNKQLGFIAQEVKEFIPQAYTETGNFIGLNYNAIVAALVKAIQELNERLNKAGL